MNNRRSHLPMSFIKWFGQKMVMHQALRLQLWSYRSNHLVVGDAIAWIRARLTTWQITTICCRRKRQRSQCSIHHDSWLQQVGVGRVQTTGSANVCQVLAKLGVKENRLEVIPNGIDIKRWSPLHPSDSQSELQREIRKKLGSERIFIYMGRIASEKMLRHCFVHGDLSNQKDVN